MTSPTTMLEIPPTLSAAFTEEHRSEDFRRWALETLVLAAVGENLVSTGQAAQLLGRGYFETLSLIKERKVPVKVSAAEQEQDEADLAKILKITRNR